MPLEYKCCHGTKRRDLMQQTLCKNLLHWVLANLPNEHATHFLLKERGYPSKGGNNVLLHLGFSTRADRLQSLDWSACHGHRGFRRHRPLERVYHGREEFLQHHRPECVCRDRRESLQPHPQGHACHGRRGFRRHHPQGHACHGRRGSRRHRPLECVCRDRRGSLQPHPPGRVYHGRKESLQHRRPDHVCRDRRGSRRRPRRASRRIWKGLGTNQHSPEKHVYDGNQIPRTRATGDAITIGATEATARINATLTMLNKMRWRGVVIKGTTQQRWTLAKAMAGFC